MEIRINGEPYSKKLVDYIVRDRRHEIRKNRENAGPYDFGTAIDIPMTVLFDGRNDGVNLPLQKNARTSIWDVTDYKGSQRYWRNMDVQDEIVLARSSMTFQDFMAAIPKMRLAGLYMEQGKVRIYGSINRETERIAKAHYEKPEYWDVDDVDGISRSFRSYPGFCDMDPESYVCIEQIHNGRKALRVCHNGLVHATLVHPQAVSEYHNRRITAAIGD